jgi:catechol 2,3-dioxygenase-like lactoylglutathione lyase family enzyme
MVSGFDRLLDRYEAGQISRRELLGGLVAIAAVTPAANAAEPTIGKVSQMNHVTMFVKDVQKSVEFYQRLFGLEVLTMQDPGVNLRVGASFLGIYPTRDEPNINHVCLGLENFNAEAVLKKLGDAGVNGRIRQRGDTKELYFTDPDNLSIQLQDTRYIGGTGELGNGRPK